MKKVEAAEAEVNKTCFLTLHATQQEISNMIQTPWIFEFRNTNWHVLLKNRYFLVYDRNIFAVMTTSFKRPKPGLTHPMQVELYKPLEDYRNSQRFHLQCNPLCTMSRKHQMRKFDKSSALELHSQLCVSLICHTISVSWSFCLGRIPLPGTKTSEDLM